MRIVEARCWLAFLVLACWGCHKQEAAPVSAIGPNAPVLAFGTASETLEAAPISLTGTDGSGLTLVSVEARTVLEDPLAFTELHLTFHNPEPRRREGRFTITLPDNAAISRFAMRVGNAFQEGEVVEKKRAQVVYEEFLHRRQDPALLEKSAGNQFSARVFPIEANANKEIIVAYSEELTTRAEPYRLRISGLPRIAELKVDVLLGSSTDNGLESSTRARGPASRLTLLEHNYAPRADLEVKLPARKPFALRSGNLVVARVAPAARVPAEAIGGLTVLFDTSASRALGFAAQVERLAALLTELARREPELAVHVVAFDQTSEDIYSGPAQDFGLRDKARLIERDAFGASDFGQALSQLAATRQLSRRLLLVSDGVITAGAEDTTLLREAVAKLAAHGVERLDVLAEGGIEDTETLRALTQAGLKSTGVLLDAGATAAKMAERLLKGTIARVTAEVSGASFSYPHSFEGLQSGDERLVFAELPEGTPVQIDLGNAGATALPTLEVPRALIERAFARAKIAALTAQARALPDAAAQQDLETEIVALSTSARVVSDYTALLVLETEDDYLRFGIPRNSLTDILSVGPEGLALADRTKSDAKGAPVEVAADENVQRGSSPVAHGEGAQEILRAEDERARAAPAKAPSAEAPAASEKRVAPAPMATSRAAASSGAAAAPSAPADGESEDAKAKDTLSGAAPARDSAAPARDSAAPALGSAAPALGSLGGLGASGTAGGGGGVAAARTIVARVHGAVTSASGLPFDDAQRAWRGNLARIRHCYEASTAPTGTHDSLDVALQIAETGLVADVSVTRGSLADAGAQSCIVRVLKQLRFPKPEGGRALIAARCDLAIEEVDAPSDPAPVARPRAAPVRARIDTPSIEDAYSGDLASVFRALQAGDTTAAENTARAAHTRDPGDVLALIALGEALEARIAGMREKSAADALRARTARVYGSLIDLFPSRPDLRRLAGERLERLAEVGLPLAIDTYQKALAQRPDHPSAHRLLAYALLKHGQYANAFQALERALALGFRGDRFPAVDRVLREDLALAGAAWARAEPASEVRVKQSLDGLGVKAAHEPSLRFVLNWETDANDVDFHIYDGRGGHAFYQSPRLASGGSLYADITSGYGPECFTVPGRAQAFPYVLQAHYFARGPMGYGMGKLEIVQHDGHGVLAFAEYPFVIMKDKAFVELARLNAPL